jgi:hypothetical protein
MWRAALGLVLFLAAGGAATLVDPDEQGEAGQALIEVLEGGPEIEARRQRGLTHAANLTWARAAAGVAAVYRAVREAGAGRPGDATRPATASRAPPLASLPLS